MDEILGTGVDTLFFGLASGATFLHDTRVGKRWGEGVSDHNHEIMWWCAAKNLERALAGPCGSRTTKAISVDVGGTR